MDLLSISKFENKVESYGPYVVVLKYNKKDDKKNMLKYIKASLQTELYKNCEKMKDVIPFFNSNLSVTHIRNRCFEIIDYYKIDSTNLYVQFKINLLIEGNHSNKPNLSKSQEQPPNITNAKLGPNSSGSIQKSFSTPNTDDPDTVVSKAVKEAAEASAAAKKASNEAKAAAEKASKAKAAAEKAHSAKATKAAEEASAAKLKAEKKAAAAKKVEEAAAKKAAAAAAAKKAEEEKAAAAKKDEEEKAAAAKKAEEEKAAAQKAAAQKAAANEAAAADSSDNSDNSSESINTLKSKSYSNLYDIATKILTTSKLNDIFIEYAKNEFNDNREELIRKLKNPDDEKDLLKFVDYIKGYGNINQSDKYKIISSLMNILKLKYNNLFYVYEFNDHRLNDSFSQPIKIRIEKNYNYAIANKDDIVNFIGTLKKDRDIFTADFGVLSELQIKIRDYILKSLLNILIIHIDFGGEKIIYDYIKENPDKNFDFYITKLKTFLKLTSGEPLNLQTTQAYNHIIQEIRDYEDIVKKSSDFYYYDFEENIKAQDIREKIRIQKESSDDDNISAFITELPSNKTIFTTPLSNTNSSERHTYIFNHILKSLLNILIIHIDFGEGKIIYDYIKENLVRANNAIYLEKLKEMLGITDSGGHSLSNRTEEIYRNIIQELYKENPSVTTPVSSNLTLSDTSLIEKPEGFYNLGNTCFMNSGLQLFYSHPGFNILIQNQNLFDNINQICIQGEYKLPSHNLNDDEEPERLLDEADCSYFRDSKNKSKYNEIIGYIRDKNYRKIHENLQDFLMPIYTKGKQEDANDFLTFFLSFIRIKIEIKDSGELNYNYKDSCILCEKKKSIFPNYSKTVCEGAILTIHIEDNNTMSYLILKRCEDETIEYTGITKKINELPKYLMIQVKRFNFNKKIGRSEKNNNVIYGCEELNLETFGKYRLESVIIHMGSANGGHYYTYRRAGIKDGVNVYYELNDSYVSELLKYSQIKDNIEGKKLTGNDYTNTNGYIFLYTKISDTLSEEGLNRFKKAQKDGGKNGGSTYQDAISEFENGSQKKLHYIWYVLPQLDGIIPQGTNPSSSTQYYSIKDYNEAKEYLKDSDLSYSYYYYIKELYNLLSSKKKLENFFPPNDDKKYQSSFVLFLLASFDIGDSYSTVKDIRETLIRIFKTDKTQYTNYKQNTIGAITSNMNPNTKESIKLYDRQIETLINENILAINDEKVKKLVNMGFNEQKAKEALSASSGNCDVAIHQLLEFSKIQKNVESNNSEIKPMVFFDLDDTLIIKCDEEKCKQSELKRIGTFNIAKTFVSNTIVYTTIGIQKMLQLLNSNDIEWTVISAGDNKNMFDCLKQICDVNDSVENGPKFNINNKDFLKKTDDTKGYQVKELSKGKPFIFCDDSLEQIRNVISQNLENDMKNFIHADGEFQIEPGWNLTHLSDLNCKKVLELCGIQGLESFPN